MDVLNNILGNPEKRSQFDDFIGRYQQGSPYDGIDDDEAVQRYEEITPTLSDGLPGIGRGRVLPVEP